MNEKEFHDIDFLISDWDGTLVDSMPDYMKSFAKVMSGEFGVPEKEAKTFFLEKAGQPLSREITECAQKFTNRVIEDTLPFEAKFWDNLQGIKPKILEGAAQFLQEVKNKGIKIIVWSGTRTDVLRSNIKLLGLQQFVDFSIGNQPGSKEMVKGPGLLREISKNFNVSMQDMAKKSLVIGDGRGDIEAGKAIGSRTAGFTRIKNTSLEASGSDFLFENYSQLLQKLKP